MKKGEELLDAEVKEEKLPLLEDPKSSKADLLNFAEEMKLEVPADKKSPAAIKKFIKDNLTEDGEVIKPEPEVVESTEEAQEEDKE